MMFYYIVTHDIALFLFSFAARAQIIFESMHTKADVAAVKHSLGEVRDEALTAVQVHYLGFVLLSSIVPAMGNCISEHTVSPKPNKRFSYRVICREISILLRGNYQTIVMSHRLFDLFIYRHTV
jgi:hypothetical protein